MIAEENYDNFAESFAQVFDKINELVKNPSVTIDHRNTKSFYIYAVTTNAK